MAAGTLPKPGTRLGPCADPCAHRDCALTREMAAAPCRRCGKPIGYDTRFYDESRRDGRPLARQALVLVHAECEERAADEGRP